MRQQRHAGHVDARQLDPPLVWGVGTIVSRAVPVATATGVAEGSVHSGEKAKKGGGSSKHQKSGKKQLLYLRKHHSTTIFESTTIL